MIYVISGRNTIRFLASPEVRFNPPGSTVVSVEDFTVVLEKELAPYLERTINNPLVKLAEKGGLTLEHLREIAKQEYFIAPQEFRHMGLCIARTGRSPPPGDLQIQRTLVEILNIFISDWEAYEEFVHTLDLTLEDVRKATVLPGAQ